MLVVYAADGGLTAQGEAWHAALAAARVTRKLVVLDDADHIFSSPDAQRQLRRELADWFEPKLLCNPPARCRGWPTSGPGRLGLDHTRVTTTERDTHVATLQMKDASDRMSKALWGQG